MAILLSADFHGNNSNKEFYAVSEKWLKRKYPDIYNKITYHIILGDGGFLPSKERITGYYKSLSRRQFPILSVIGNHEPIPDMSDLKETDKNLGNTVYMIKEEYPYIAYLKCGKIYNIDGFKFLVLGGGLSICKDKQTKEIRCEQGNWSEQEEQDLFKLIETESNFDYVLSHTGPHRINKILFKEKIDSINEIDKVALMNDKIDKKIQCLGWWCGHWHENKEYQDEETGRLYYYLDKSFTTKILSKEYGEIIVY
jgi:hypothetical protein